MSEGLDPFMTTAEFLATMAASNWPGSLRNLQIEAGVWSLKNFANNKSWQPLLGAVEELGELAHAFLKRSQGIRQDEGDTILAMKDALGDIIIFLCDFASREGIDLHEAVWETWRQVQQRDWIAYPKNGRTE